MTKPAPQSADRSAMGGTSPPSGPVTRALALSGCDSIEALARTLLAALREQGMDPVCMAWSSDWPATLDFHPEQPGDSAMASRMREAIAAIRAAGPVDPAVEVLFDDGQTAIAVLLLGPDDRRHAADTTALFEAAARQVPSLLTIDGLHVSLAKLQKTERLQRALFAIADIAGSSLDMPTMLQGLHRIVADLMYAENLYIAQCEPGSDSIRFIYFADTEETQAPGPDEHLPLDRIIHGPTWWLIRQGVPLRGSEEELRRQVPGEMRSRGADSIDWLGVPMLRDGRVYGALVVQSYVEGVRYTDEDQTLLAFVAEHILTALERKSGHAQLESRVEERTQQLADANLSLQREVDERKRGEQLQEALYRIADLAGTELTQREFFARIHAIIAGLLNAENFYVALLSQDGHRLEFPYVVDERETNWESRPLSRGLTEYVMAAGKAVIVDHAKALELIDAGRINPTDTGTLALYWLGVPLRVDERTLGVVAVQSYTSEIQYGARDAELLTYVANHVASSLQRQRAASERERRDHLQSALYQIAALAATDESSEVFYRHVHKIISTLLEARNFYLALLSEDRTMLEFKYYVDEQEDPRPSRVLGHGLTEYVLRCGQGELIDIPRARQLAADGEIDPAVATRSRAQSWLGAPLVGSHGTIGVVAVQSYDDPNAYGPEDVELLNFVALQLSNSLQRRQDAEALRQANLRLEERVQSRTRELSEQITVREQIQAQLKHQVMHDPLTGLPNRLYLRDRIERAIAGLRRHPDQRFALLYLDVDRFKVINDSLGHLAGDMVLQEVSRRMLQCVREPDVVARLSGDEFAVLLEDVPQPKTATRVAQRIMESLQEPMLVGVRELRNSASIGIAISEPRHDSTDAILQDADTALYRAKSAGRRRFVLFDDSLQRAAMDVLGMEHELRTALAEEQFEPYFQPIVRLSNQAVVGYEALIRWNHPQRGVLAPGEFLPLAEECGLLEEIDWQMYRLTCSFAPPLVREGGFVTINISPRHFHGNDLDTRLLALAAETGFDPGRLRIEVTEGTLLADPDAVAKVLQRLRDAGIEAALDDFGTGYSSLGYVHHFPLKMLKIDQSFVEPLGSGDTPRSSAVVGAILALANSLELEIVAEGIENQAQLAALRKMGCLYGQGYLFGRPQPVAHWLSEDKPA